MRETGMLGAVSNHANMQIKMLCLTVVFLVLCAPLPAQDIQEPLGDVVRHASASTRGECGMVYGDEHAFTVCAPKGWVLDNSILNEQGIYAVFYPSDSTWSRAKENGTFMYVNTARKADESPTVAALMATDAQDTRAHAPAVQVSEAKPITTGDSVARVQKFERGAFNRYEAVAYLDSPKIIVMFVITSSDGQSFRQDYPTFEELVASYKFLTTDVVTPLDTARAAVKANMETPEGKQYDQVIGTEFGKRYVSVMGRCTKSASGDDLGGFDIYIKLDCSGTVQDVLLSPATTVASCVRRALVNDKFAPPPKPSYWVNISMMITP